MFQELKNKCNNLIIDEHLKNLKVLGFTNDISNLLNISNVVITKPGGLAVTEAIETKTPMILIPGNGGPENYNLKYVLKNGFGLKAKNPKQLVKRVKKLTQNPKLIKEMHKNLRLLEENTSIEKLYKLVQEMKVK